MVQPPAQAHTWRLGKGQKRSKKQEAVVTALYTMTPYQRTPQEAAAPLHDSERSEPVDRPQPVGKELRGTLGGRRWP